MPIQTVPFNPAWITKDGDDVAAIYRRPRVNNATWEHELDAHGQIQWDYTGGLPVRRHHEWTLKGYEYVTLASVADLEAAGLGRSRYLESYGRRGHESSKRGFLMQEYLKEAATTHAEAQAEAYENLRAMVAEFGVETVERIKGIRLPDALRQVPSVSEIGDATQEPERRRPGRPKVELAGGAA